MFPKSSPATITAITSATINRRPTTGGDGYSLRRFLDSHPDEDAVVVFTRSIVREGFVTGSAWEIFQPSSSATCLRTNPSRFQATGADIVSPTLHRDLSAATHTHSLEIQSSLGSFLAADQVDDANASYGRIALNETPGNHGPLMSILEDIEDVIGSNGKVGREKMSCEEEECLGYGIRRATTLRQKSAAQRCCNLLTGPLEDYITKNETLGPGSSKPDRSLD